MALDAALAGAAANRAMVEVVNLRDYDLPFCSGEDEYRESPGVARLRNIVAEANGIILATPNYHGTLSGILKNALDLMSMHEFEGKIVGLVGVSGGRMGGANTLNALRAIGRALHAWVIPSEAWVYDASSAFTAQGGLKDAATEQRLKEVGRKVARLTSMLASKEARELLALWEEAEE